MAMLGERLVYISDEAQAKNIRFLIFNFILRWIMQY